MMLNARVQFYGKHCGKKIRDVQIIGLGGVLKLRLQDLAFFDHLPPSVDIFYGINVYKKSIFSTTYPPPLVNVVCERPLMYLVK